MNAIVYCGITVRLPLLPINQLQQTVAIQRCQADDDYEQGLRNLWSAAPDIVVVEHDIVATQRHIDELLDCSAPLCAFAYYIYPASTGLTEPAIAHLLRRNGEYQWIEPGTQWADHGALGLTKLGRLARREVADWPTTDGDAAGGWWNLDTRISRTMNAAGLRYHIHWPIVEHEHK